ncbi:unnamed protein product (mitochondrion) [Plasmodiophora brassicae]|uniref:EF-hand domain-containing protein n=1 Tax=Plasmodiophora brassicae TaxID=37360 RepID=A0A3P3YLQ1_PLABS|nr:unnamed protein product [Plasmodiophora brassicae]
MSEPCSLVTLRIAFRLMDFDNDGVVSEADLRRWMTGITPISSPDQISSMHAWAASLSRSQRIDFPTFVALATVSGEQLPALRAELDRRYPQPSSKMRRPRQHQPP